MEPVPGTSSLKHSKTIRILALDLRRQDRVQRLLLVQLLVELLHLGCCEPWGWRFARSAVKVSAGMRRSIKAKL